VVFQDLSVGSHFLAGKCDHRTSVIMANFHDSRGAVGPKLMKSVSAAWTRLTGQSEEQLVITLNEAELEAMSEQNHVRHHAEH
jgi:hypothetical protein